MPAEASVPNYPPPPGAPPATSTTQDTSPPPAYDQAMQQSTKNGRASRAAVTTDETGHGSQSSTPSGNPSGKSQTGTGVRSGAIHGTDIPGGDQLHGIHMEAIGRSAAEALQIQVGRHCCLELTHGCRIATLVMPMCLSGSGNDRI